MKWKSESICYGGDYNPEQWDESVIAEDIELMVESGVNLVTLGVFAWARLEPRPGEYTFDWLESLMDRLYAAGINVDLATATATPPIWMAREFPQTLPKDINGVTLNFGSRQQYCPNSPEFRTFSVNLVKALAERLGNHPALKLWHISNEYGCHIWECFCERCAEAFRGFLRERYGDVKRLNTAWGTAFWSQEYSDIAQIEPPAAMPTFRNPSQMLDWRRFCAESLLACYRVEADELKRLTPNVPITTNFMGLFTRADYWRWAQFVDVVSDDSYPDPADPAAAAQVAFEADLMRSLKSQPFLLMEQTSAAVQWRPRNSPKRPGVHKLHSLLRIGHGADAILQFQWRQSVRGAETFHSAMVPHSGRNSRIFRETCDLGETLGRLGQIVGQELSADIAIMWDWQSEWAREAAIGPFEAEWGLGVRRWHRSLFEAGYAVDFVPTAVSWEGNKGNISYERYKLIIVPEVFALDSATVVALKRAAENGTEILIASPSGLVDENLGAYLQDNGGALGDLTGVRLLEPWLATVGQRHDDDSLPPLYDSPDPRVDRVTSAVTVTATESQVCLEPDSVALQRCLDRVCSPRPMLVGRAWAELLEVCSDDVDVLATYRNTGSAKDIAGNAAITRRRVGDGACIYISTDLDAVGRAVMVALAAAYARVRPVMSDLPAGVHASQRGKFLFLTNHSDRAVELSGVSGWMLLTNKNATGHIVLAPRSGEVILQS